MKWIKVTGMAVSLSMGIAGFAQATPTVEPPVVMEEAMLSITISDLHGLIDGIGSVAALVSPMMNGTMLKNMLGMQLGDPGLMGIAPGKGLAVVALDPTTIFAVIEVNAAQVSAYTNALAPKGVQFEYANGLLVVGQTPEQVAKGVAMGSSVKSTLLAKRSPTLRVAGQPSAIIERNNDQIQGLIAMMPMLLGQGLLQAPGGLSKSAQAAAQILEGELLFALSLASQCETVEVVLAPQAGSVRISETYVPKAGTRLASLGDAPVVNRPNPRVKPGYLGDGAVEVDMTLSNPKALMDFVLAEVEQLSNEMDLTEIDLAGLMGIKEKFWAVSGGSLCESVDFGGESGMSVGYLMDVKDEAEALVTIKELFQGAKPIMKLYEDLGMPLSIEFKENAREYKGVNIHQFFVDMAVTNQPEDVAEQLATLNLTNLVYDLAITDHLLVCAMGGEKVETFLDRLTDESFQPTPLAARSVYPDGGFYYFDLDVGKYMEFAMPLSSDSGNAMMQQQMATLFQGAEPVTSAGFKADGRVMWSINVPGELIAKYGQMAMMMQMQQMQQGGGMPMQTMPQP